MIILRYIFAITAVIFLSLLLISCDNCAGGTGEYQMIETDIYFTSSAVNSHVTGIFRINKEGREFSPVVNNAQIYSEPSATNKIVYTSFVAQDVKYIFKSDIDGRNPQVVQKENFSNDKLYPVLSSDGRFIVVNDVSRGLWLIDEENEYIKISEDFCENTLPSFSPDGTKLAYYEGGFLYNPLSVVILDLTQSPPVEINRKIHSTGLEKYSGEATIGWSKDGQKICYVLTLSIASDFIFIADVLSSNETAFEVTSIGAYQPALSNDMSQVVFAARDGNLWIRNLVDTTKRYLQLTTSGKVSTSLYPMWSDDGQKIMFVKQFKDEEDIMTRTLEIIDIRYYEDGSKVLSNNVFRGFWNRNRK